jgi:iron(III) transport system substrate-binding protein
MSVTRRVRGRAVLLVAALLAGGATPAAAQGALVVYCSVRVDWCQLAAVEFERATGIKTIAPCEGTGYEIGSMSLIKGGRNAEKARKWYDWALTAEAQALAARAKSYQVPSNRSAPVPARAPRLADVELIEYDFVRYGQSAERKRLIERWEREVGSQPR